MLSGEGFETLCFVRAGEVIRCKDVLYLCFDKEVIRFGLVLLCGLPGRWDDGGIGRFHDSKALGGQKQANEIEKRSRSVFKLIDWVDYNCEGTNTTAVSCSRLRPNYKSARSYVERGPAAEKVTLRVSLRSR
jgi:hypothetical protein